MSPTGHPLDEALAVTRHMLAACREQQWDALPQLEAQRRGLLLHAFDDPVAAAARSGVIREIMAMDREILACCEHEKQVCAEELQQFNKARQVAGAYHDQLSQA